MTLYARGAGPLWQKKQRSLPVERVFSDRWNDFHCQAIFLHHRTEKWLTEYHIWNIDMIVQYTVCIWVLYLQWDFAWTSFDQLLYWQQFDAKFLHIELRTYTSTDFLPGWPPFFALFASSYLARAKYANLNTSVNLQPCPQKTEQGFCKHPELVSLSEKINMFFGLFATPIYWGFFFIGLSVLSVFT